MKTSLSNGVALYGIIAGLTALMATPDPLTWRSGVGIALATFIAIKAKLSPQPDQDKP